jgi:hypothetical protein
VDGVAGTPATVTPNTNVSNTRMGANTAATASQFHLGQIATVLITSPLSTDQAAQLTAYLKARGGIA